MVVHHPGGAWRKQRTDEIQDMYAVNAEIYSDVKYIPTALIKDANWWLLWVRPCKMYNSKGIDYWIMKWAWEMYLCFPAEMTTPNTVSASIQYSYPILKCQRNWVRWFGSKTCVKPSVHAVLHHTRETLRLAKIASLTTLWLLGVVIWFAHHLRLWFQSKTGCFNNSLRSFIRHKKRCQFTYSER